MMTQELNSYLAVRRAAGFQLKKVEKFLRSFVRFNEDQLTSPPRRLLSGQDRDLLHRSVASASRRLLLSSVICPPKILATRFRPMIFSAVIKSDGVFRSSSRLLISTASSRPLPCLVHPAPYGVIPTALFSPCCRSRACEFLKRCLCGWTT
jgi:hypothetical protein